MILRQKRHLRNKAKRERQEKFIQGIMDSEPELDAMDPNLICPVCLDLLYEPFRALPCRHTFCETCLRRLGSKNAMDTSCPMCRQKIVFCETETELRTLIHESHPEMYAKRHKFEKTSNPSVFNLPLPWTPGWRNLISGRPMGGNAFESTSYAELFRRVIQQLPYYIPPVVLANLINLVFFVFLLFAVEVVPTLLGLLMRRQSKGPEDVLQSLQPTSKLVSVDQDVIRGGGIRSEIRDSGTPAVSGAGEMAAHGEVVNENYEGEVSSSPAAAAASAAAASVLEAMTGDDSVSVDLASGLYGDPHHPALPDPSAHQPMPAMPEGATNVMDTTFYYALYLVLFIGTLIGNFFLLNHPTTVIPRGSVFDRFVHHPRWGRFNRRLLDVCLVLVLTTIPIVTLPLLISAGTESVAAATGHASPAVAPPPHQAAAAAGSGLGDPQPAAASVGRGLFQPTSHPGRSILESWVSRLIESCTTFMPISYFLAAMAVVWVVSIYLDCHDDDGILF